MILGVIDVGSNTVRLCVYDVSIEKRKFKTIMNRKIMAGLAAYIVDGALSGEGIAEAIASVKKCQKRASYLNPSRVDVFATAVLRNVSNSKKAIAAIEEGAGCKISLLSSVDEAHLGFVGASSRGALENGALVDIGGGSTEITRIKGGADIARTSLPQGSLSSYGHFVADILPTAEEIAVIRGNIRGLISADETNACAKEAPELYGVGGSIRALSEVNAWMNPEATSEEISRGDVERLLGAVTDQRRAFVDAVLHVSPERIHTISCGLAILAEVFDELQGERLRVCDRGVREGYLIERMLGLSDLKSK